MDYKYYFISYRWKNYDKKVAQWQLSNTVVNHSPMIWLRNQTDDYYGGKSGDIYQIEFYHEINKIEYDAIYGHID